MKKPEFEIIKFNDELNTHVVSCIQFCTSDCSAVCGAGDCDAECVGYCPFDGGCPWN